MTKREMFVAIANVAEVAANEEMVAFINRQIELLDNRKSSAHGMTKTQKENIGIKELIVDALVASGKAMTVTELLGCDGLGGYTNQKISSLLRQLVSDGKVEKDVSGKKALFKAVTVE